MYFLPRIKSLLIKNLNPQQGFAPLGIVVLLLVGITAATLLTQSRTNFLPQAADEVIRIKYSYSCDAPGGYRTLSITQGTTSLYYSDKVACNEAASVNRPCSDTAKGVCGSQNMQCERDSDYDAHCVARKEQPSGTIFPCTLEQAKSNSLSNCPSEGQKLLISHCDSQSHPPDKAIGNEDCLNMMLPSQQNYYCYWNKQCSTGQQSPTGPAPATATSGNDYTPGVAGKCDDKQKHKNNDPSQALRCPPQPNSSDTECVLDKLETKWCIEPGKKEGDSCNTSNCPAYEGDKKECRIVGGLPKCRYPNSAKDGACNDPDKGQCPAGSPYNEECWIFGTDYKYSACRKKAGTPAAAAPATAPRPATAGAPATAAQPATQRQTGTAPAPATGTQPRPQTAAAPAVPAADIICGKDDKGIDIPCYSIGVFSPAELTSREAQAKITSVNYAKFRKILDDEEAKIGAEVANQAKKQIAAAEEALKACIK